jgi:FkbM family methyltransferase
MGHHIAVEPVPYKATWLRRNFPGVEVHEVALGDEDTRVEFFFFSGKSAFSGLSRRGASPGETTAITVRCKRLDDIVPPGMPIGFIKIDVEGAEFSVFRGARRVISEGQPVVLFECLRANLISYGLTANQIFSLLTQDISYNIFLLPTWLSGGPPLDLPTFEACMVYPFRALNFVAAPRSPDRR